MTFFCHIKFRCKYISEGYFWPLLLRIQILWVCRGCHLWNRKCSVYPVYPIYKCKRWAMMSIEAMTDLRISFRHQSLGVTCMFFRILYFYFQGYSLCGTVYKKKIQKNRRVLRDSEQQARHWNKKSHGTTHKHHNEIINVVHLTIVTFYDILHLGFRIEKAKS